MPIVFPSNGSVNQCLSLAKTTSVLKSRHLSAWLPTVSWELGKGYDFIADGVFARDRRLTCLLALDRYLCQKCRHWTPRHLTLIPHRRIRKNNLLSLNADEDTVATLALRLLPTSNLDTTLFDGVDFQALEPNGNGAVLIEPGQDAHNRIQRAFMKHDFYEIATMDDADSSQGTP